MDGVSYCKYANYFNVFIQINAFIDINLVDNDAKDIFMNYYFPNTSILHAYNSINPSAKVSARLECFRMIFCTC